MKEKPVSIIIPFCNSAICIEDAIYSVLRQTYPNWKLLIADDAPLDNSIQFINLLDKN